MRTNGIFLQLRSLNRYIDISFIAKFIGLFLLFYYTNIFFVQLTLPGKWHSDFFSNNLNYVQWLTDSLTHMSGYIANLLGVENYVKTETNSIVSATNGRGVIVKWECIGLGIYSFWLAFILAHKMNIKRKILFSISGLILMWLLNCIRIALLLYGIEHNLKAWKKSWKFIGNVNHHDLYNYVCYILIIGMIYFYYRRTTKKTATLKVNSEQNKS
ncbi:MAG: archaeosortase/exosortase family protein [Agriterribacter sp.]